MASASAPSFRCDLPLRKPMASESGMDAQHTALVRQAFGADVVGSNLSPRAQLGYRVLVDHVNRGRDPRRPYDGQVFLTDETFAAELGGVSKRQVQRIRSELLADNRICLPKGDAGGRGNATIWYHLHPDGRPCSMAAGVPLKQRAAAEQANQRRAAARKLKSCTVVPKDDIAVILSGAPNATKDDRGIVFSPERMTESTVKDDKNDVKDDRIDIAYKEELFQELIPEPKSTTTASDSKEFPPEFVRLMDNHIALDDGALRRLWQQARAIVPDVGAEEIQHFFQQRARAVYRNRKLDNPTGLMLSTIPDWFPRRRVLERRRALQEAAEEAEALQLRIAEERAKFHSPGQPDWGA